MAVLFSDNLDGESEGTSPPANWVEDTVKTLLNLEVDDAHANSLPHSIYALTDTATGGYHHDYGAGYDEEYTKMAIYLESGGEAYFVLQSTTGDYVSNKRCVNMRFNSNGDIEYYDGSWKDTGYNWTAGAFKVLKILPHCGTDTFDAWYDGVQIVNGGDFEDAGASIKSIQVLITTDGNNRLWVDDIQIGEEAGWTGKINGITNPAKVDGIAVADIEKINGR